MEFLNSIPWEEVVPGQFTANPGFQVTDYFEIVRQPADGNCFYHSIAELFVPNKNDFSFRLVKQHLELAARRFFEEEPEAKGLDLGLEKYLEVAMCDNEWGGSLEASMLAKHLDITIVIWVIEGPSRVAAAVKFGPGDVAGAINLLHTGYNHFDALRLLVDDSQASRQPRDITERIEIVEEVLSEDREETFFEEDLLNFATAETIEEKLTRQDKKVQDEMQRRAVLLGKIIKKGENIPVRVGRVLDCLFNCKLFVELRDGLLVLKPESKEDPSIGCSLRQLGHKLLTRDKQIKQEYAKSKLYLTKDLLDHLDAGGLLRSAFPGMGLERNLQFLHSEILLDVCTVVVAVLLSSFLYGSNNRNKKTFITNCLLNTSLSGKRVFKALGKLTGVTLYRSPRSALSHVCQALYGKMMGKLQSFISVMSPISLLALRNLDFDNMSVKDYMEMLKEMSVIDNTDVDYTHREIADLNQLTDKLQKLFKEGRAEELKNWFKEEELTKRSLRSVQNASEFLISDYFKRKDIMKFISTTGKASSTGNIGNILSYAHNLYLSKESLKMTTEDTTQLLIEIKRLYKLQGEQSIEPIAIICDKLEEQFRKLFKELPEECSLECQTLFNDIRNSGSHSTAWKHALRLKGTAYEGMFSRQYGWSYIPEDIKPSLTMLIQTLFPHKFEEFLDRTQLHPEFRDLTPDFALTQKVYFKKNKIVEIQNTQLVIDSSLEGSVEAVPVVEKKMFPLPETPVDEVHSIQRIMKSFRDKVEQDKKRKEEEGDKAPTDEHVKDQIGDGVQDQDEPALTTKGAKQEETEETEETKASPESKGANKLQPALALTTSRGTAQSLTRGPLTYSDRILIDENSAELTEEEELEKRQILLVEVGYQTDVDGKITTDFKKWKDILKLLEMLEIKCSFIACADCTSTPADNWWISEDKVRCLKSSISHLFSSLTKNSPADVTDIVVGSISTQKVRSYLKSGSATKTPVSSKDVKETWQRMRQNIMERPTGAVINSGLESAMRQGLVDGVVMSKEGCVKTIETLKQNCDKITDGFERTKYKHELNENRTTSEKLLLGWLSEDLQGCRCSSCLNIIKQTVESITENSDRLEYLASSTILKSHCPDCHPRGVSVSNSTNIMNRLPGLENIQHSDNKGFEDTNEALTDLDRVVRLTLPGKTEKERRIKRNVETLIRLMMQASGLECIKLPSGQIITHRLTRKIKQEDENVLLDKQTEKLERIKKELSDTKLSSYSEYVKKTLGYSIQRVDKQKESKCSVPRAWLEKLLRDLKVPTKDEDILTNIRESMSKKTNFVENNDKLVIRSEEELIRFIENRSVQLMPDKSRKLFQSDCILFKEVTAEAMKRYYSTPYEGVPEMIVLLINFLCRFPWFQEVVLYGKICETFLRCCTEFSRSGIKLVKVRHCDLNLAIKLPSNKKENMLCTLYNKEMELLKGPFFLNRRQAVLGASYPYIIITLYMQVLQQHRCLEVLRTVGERTFENIKTCTSDLIASLMLELTYAVNGQFEMAYGVRTRQCKLGGNFLNRSSRDHFITVISGLNTVYGLIIRDNLLANSQQQNKQLQMLRFGMLSGLSRLSCPKELGKKFSTSCRRLEDNIMRLYLQSTVYCSNRDVEHNINEWKLKDLCPEVTIPCFSVYGVFVNSDRQLIFDIYNVHIYNKEMDNFDEGCISVLEETAERHMLWEMDLLRSLSKETKDERLARLLLGCPNVRKAVDKEGNKLSKARHASPEDEDSDSSSLSGRRSYCSSKGRIQSIFGRYNSNKKPFEFRPGLEVSADPMNDFEQAVTDTSQYAEYTPNQESLMKDFVQIIRMNPSHTMGSFELIQAVTEFGRSKYPAENIEKAKRDPKNWVSISEVTETTSIVSQPRTHIMLKDCFKILLGTENKKIVKMLRGKLKKLGAISTDIEIGRKDCLDMLNTVEGLSEEQRKNIVNGIFEPSKLSFYHWKELVQKDVEEVLLTDDGNYIFCWLKTLSSMLKGALKKELRFMNSGGVLELNNGFFSEDEFEELLNVKKELTGSMSLDRELNTELLLASWLKCIYKPKEGAAIVQEGLEALKVMAGELYEIRLQHLELTRMKKDNPSVSFTKEEVLVKRLEKSFLKKFNKEAMKFVNLVFFCSLSAPWCIHYKSLESYLVRHPEILELKAKGDLGSVILDLSVASAISRLVQQETSIEMDVEVLNEMKVRFAVKYFVTLFTANGEPFSLSLNDGGLDENLQKTTDEKLLHQTKVVFTKIGLAGNNYDFMWTTQMIANSNFNVCKRLTGRTTGERLPRSVRSKVIYEMVKLVGETGMAILQQLAFAQALNYDHRFYAVLAPKAQLGGSRDLLVQETGTKVIHATTEMFSRNLLKTTQDDGLTNPHLKETILNVGLDALSTMRLLDGRPVSEDSKLLNFYKVICISGDNTKWGPIHCCSFFSGMIQQLLKDVPDWSSFYKLAFIKNLCRQVEIPAASVKKILNTLRFRLSNKGGVESKSEEELRKELSDSTEEWGDNDTVKFLITTYLSKGIMALNSYNHMGQGIHHATSSLLTSLMAELFEELVIDYFKRHLPQLTVNVTHAGSSDDYAKCIVATGLLPKELYDRYSEAFWKHACKIKNFTAAVQRCCQMKDSAKTLVGDCFLEFYSEFMMGNRVTPAVIKFIFTGLINSSVTSPQSLVQACHVSSQQAMYNSVPLMTNATFTLLRQQVFFSHVEDFVRRYGLITLGTVSSFGRLFVPTFSGLVSSAVALEDSEVLAKSAAEINENNIFLDSSSLSNLDSLKDADSTKARDDESSVSETTIESTESGSSSSSFTFELTRPLSETELQFLKTLKSTTSVTACEIIQDKLTPLYADSQEGALDKYNVLYNSRLTASCDWLRQGRKRGPLELARRLQCILNILIVGYYRSFGSDGTDKQVKASLNRDDNRVVEDPMIQLIPEKLRRELERLGVSRMEIDELMPSIKPDETLCQLVAKKLISLNVATEEYTAEVSRLKQTLTARNVLHGLAGGIKELSLPIYTIFLKSYFFKDNVFLDLEDRWSTKHSSNYRDSSGRMLTGRVITKFTHWLDTFLNCMVSINRTQEIKDNSLFNPDLRCINILVREDNIKEMSIVQSHLRVVTSEFNNLNLQFSDCNRQKLKVVESRPPECELEANKAVIVKSKLFSAVEQVRLANNPAVVMGYLLEESSISEVKPTKVDFSNLLKDRFKLMQFFPSVFALLKHLQSESSEMEKLGAPVDMQQVSKYSNHLTLLCRMIQQARPSLTVFYMLKGNQMNTEPTVSELVSYGIKEGRYLRLPEIGLDASTYSVKYWKILHCISAIGELPLSDRDKTSLLISFLNWKVSSDSMAQDCPLYKQEHAVISEFAGQVVVNTLASELSSVRKDAERDSLTDLIDYVNSPTELLKKKPYLGTTCKFTTWGENNRNGKFTYSSRSGEAIGIFIAGKLHIHLSRESTGLLCEVERNVLGWLGRRRTDVLTKEQHQQFLEFLPTLSEVSQKNRDGTTQGLCQDSTNVRMLKFVHPKKNTPVVKIKGQILTVKKQVSFEAESEPRLMWGHGCVSVVYDECETQTTYHENLLKIKQMVDSTTDRARSLPQSVFSDTKVILARIRFKSDLLLNSLCLLHSFLRHTTTDAVLEAESKCALLERYLQSGGVRVKSADETLERKLCSKVIECKLEQTLDEEIEVCDSLNRVFSETPVPVSSWSEVQCYIEDVGFSNVLITLDKTSTKGELIWKFSLDNTSNIAGSIKDIRSLVSYISTETIPKFLLPFLLFENLLSSILKQSLTVKETLHSTGISDKEIEAVATLFAYCFQNDKVKRKGPRCSMSSILNLTKGDWVEIGQRMKLQAHLDSDIVRLNVQLAISTDADQTVDKKARVSMAKKVIASQLTLLLQEDGIDIKKLKDMAVNVQVRKEKTGEVLDFTLLDDQAGNLNYIGVLETIMDRRKKGPAISALEDFFLLLTGMAESNIQQNTATKSEEAYSDDICLEDLLEPSEESTSSSGTQDKETVPDRVTFNWDSDSD
uniref:RNA-directed RNA polymerase L n=1 Tax=Nairobi sheep disease virus TaxID=194540 RepID=D0PRM9_9VIRU|nr:RNA-dependent RNA polymerase [Nairobi sheep disease virus]